MSNVVKLSAEMRERAGKGAARKVRREGRVPAVIYGEKKDPVMISLDPSELKRYLFSPGFYSHIYEVDAGKHKEKVLARDVQMDVVKELPIHVDFLRFGKNTRIDIEVVVNFTGDEDSPGLKAGGVLNVVRHTLTLNCSPDNMPESIDIDVSTLDIGDSVHISDVTLPDGVESSIDDRDFTIATIAAPTKAPSEEEEAEEGEEAAEEGEAAEAEAAEEGGEEESSEE